MYALDYVSMPKTMYALDYVSLKTNASPYKTM